MRIPSGVTDQYIYFVAVDSTDLKSRETGLSSFTVYRSRDGGAAAAMTTPTINETDASNMPGVYELLLDEDMTIGSGNDSEEMAFHITHAGMAPVTRVIELYRPKITAGNTLGVAADGDISGNVDGAVASVTGAVGSVTGAVGSVTGLTQAGIADAVWDEAATGHTDAGKAGAQLWTDIDAILVDTAVIGAAGAGLTAVPWNAAWDAEVQSEVNDGLVAYDAATGADVSGLNDPTAAAIADAVWDELQADHVGAGSFGVIATEIADILTDTADMQPKLGTPNNLGSGANLSANALDNNTQLTTNYAGILAIPDNVWDEAQAGHVGVGTFGEIATEIASILDDTGTAGVVLANDAISADKIAANAITSSEIAANAIGASQLAADAVTEIWAKVIETNGSITAQQAMSLMLAVLAGVTNTSGGVFLDPSGTSTRVSVTLNASQERTAVTATPSA